MLALTEFVIVGDELDVPVIVFDDEAVIEGLIVVVTEGLLEVVRVGQGVAVAVIVALAVRDGLTDGDGVIEGLRSINTVTVAVTVCVTVAVTVT